METLSFQAPEEMKAKLELFASKLDRSKGYLIRQALEDYLEEIEDYLEAKKYMETKYNPKNNISLDEIKKKYNLDD